MSKQFPSLPRAFFLVGFYMLAAMLLTTVASAQTTTPADKPPLKQEELDQLIAPIALYPDSLLSQILMASTYPLEIVQADRWAKAHKDLKDPQLTTELEKQTWDPSVKSLINFPDVLAMMSDKLDLTMKLGDAFIEQQKDVMNTVQRLRSKAEAQGNLKSNEQQKVVVEAAPAQTSVVVEQVTPAPEQIIRIEQTNPQVIYVPSYSPSVVYGAWPYPAYPPAPYYPPGYVASNVISFGLGVAAGAAWGYAWGNCNWGGGDVDIDVNQNNNFNRNNNNSRQNFQNRQNNNMQGGRGNGQGGRGNGQGGGRGSWQHNPSHRGGVPYRDNKTSQRFGNSSSRQAAQSRESYRGRADAGRQDLSRGGANGVQNNRAGSNSGLNRGQSGTGVQNNRAGSNGQSRQSRGASAQNRSGSSAQRSQSSANRGGGLSGVDRGGSAARSASQRGQTSRSSSPSRSRSTGGGSRGGGGGGRRGGGGGGRR